VPLPPGKTQFSVETNNNNNKCCTFACTSYVQEILLWNVILQGVVSVKKVPIVVAYPDFRDPLDLVNVRLFLRVEDELTAVSENAEPLEQRGLSVFRGFRDAKDSCLMA
jgi:hypothetical protein